MNSISPSIEMKCSVIITTPSSGFIQEIHYLFFQVETEKKEMKVKVEEKREEWAVMEDTEKTVEDFHRLVPDMAHKVRFQSYCTITEEMAELRDN